MLDKKNQTNRAYSYILMAGHICCDLNQSTTPALLPFLVAQRGIDFTSAAGLSFAASFLSSLIQPLLGMISDRKQRPWLMGLGILFSGLGIAAIGFLESYWAIFAVIMFAGLGSAMFHPEGGRMANYAAGEKKGRGVSIFSAGGNLGFVIGPLVVTASVMRWGLRGTAIMLIPAVVMATIFFLLEKKLELLSETGIRDTTKKAVDSKLKDDVPAFLRLCIPVFTRSIAQNGLSTFIPLYWVSVLMQTQQRGSLMVTFIALAGATAAFIGGRLADRFGFRRIIWIALATVPPLIIMVLLTKNIWTATVLVMMTSLALHLTASPAIVLGQTYLPNRLGLASGVTLGLAISIGGITSPLLGRIGDNYGLTTVLYVVSGIALLSFLGSLLIKKEKVKKKD